MRLVGFQVAVMRGLLTELSTCASGKGLEATPGLQFGHLRGHIQSGVAATAAAAAQAAPAQSVATAVTWATTTRSGSSNSSSSGSRAVHTKAVRGLRATTEIAALAVLAAAGRGSSDSQLVAPTGGGRLLASVRDSPPPQ